MTDRELLELAAKAAGLPYIKPLPEYSGSLGLEVGSNPMRTQTWNPLRDDGDALRLAVTLGLQIRHYPIYDTLRFAVLVVDRKWNSDAERDASDDTMLHYDGDPFAATRRAIVRAAAAIGEQA